MAEHVLIVGGGFSGTMLAVNLLRRPGPRVTLVERRAEPALGLAYGAAHESHLLNVRASNMSALADEPDHFVRWLADRGMADPAAAFAPRPLFGAYLQEVFRTATEQAPGRLEVIAGSVLDLQTSPAGVTARLSDGRILEADAAALALGNLPPHPPRGLDPERMPPGRYYGDPWTPVVADGLGPDHTVLIIGTGLTMVDMALLLEARGFGGRILALSRRGLLPHAHAPGAPPDSPRHAPPATTAPALVREIRARAEEIGWRQAVDELRPFTQFMWRSAGPEQRSRFLRHLRPWWDVHRHRIAPQVRARIEDMIRGGLLTVAAGKISGFETVGDRTAVTWRPRGLERSETFAASRIINCTGPEGNLPASPEPLLRSLLGRGVIRPGWCGIGVAVDEESRIIDAGGQANERLVALGPLTRGAFWEIVAVPDIRVQVRQVAERWSG